MATKGAYKRLTKEYINIQKSPPAYLFARPLESNILEWHYVLKGPPETPYFGGEYHGKLVFPSDYPFKPPSIRMITPNGRFQVDTRLCLSMSDFHPGTWNPSWSVSTILNGLLSFMSQDESTTGSITTTSYDKALLAHRSHSFNMTNPKFKDIFPELVGPQQIPLHIAFPNAPVTDASGSQDQVPIMPGSALKRRPAAHTGPEVVQQVVAGAGAVGGNNGAAAAAAAVRRQSLFSMGHWHKWLAFFLVFAYLLVAKMITRASASASNATSR